MAKKKDEARQVEETAERMLRELEARREEGGTAYPPTLERLAQLSVGSPTNPLVTKAVAKKLFTDRAVVTWSKDRKPARDAFVLLATEAEMDSAVEACSNAILVGLLRRSAQTKTPSLSISKLRDKLTKQMQKPFQKAIKDQIERGSLPPDVGWLPDGQSQRLFLLSAVRNSRGFLPGEKQPRTEMEKDPALSEATPPGRTDARPEVAFEDFASAFRACFDRLDRLNRLTNFVRLSDLRKALANFNREQFDSGLRQLRLADEFTLDSHEGRHQPLAIEEVEAGIREAGSLFVYVSRRS